MANSESPSAPRPAPLRVLLPDGVTEVSIPPITIGQARAALRLDPADGHKETARAGIVRQCAQAKVLLGPSLVYLCDVWTPAQMREVVAEIYRAACGPDAAAYARANVAPRKESGQVGAYDLLARLEALCTELATALGKQPEELETMPFAEAVARRAQITA